MTARPMPVPARITLALDSIAAEGPWVDQALGGAEPMVDDWEAGKYLPTPEQVEKLAALTRMPVEFFYRPADELGGPSTTFLCDRRRRGDNGLTIIRSHVDYDGVLHREQITPDRPPYRPRPALKPGAETGKPAAQLRRPGTHPPRENPDTPGHCACGLPLDAPNRRHAEPCPRAATEPARAPAVRHRDGTVAPSAGTGGTSGSRLVQQGLESDG